MQDKLNVLQKVAMLADDIDERCKFIKADKGHKTAALILCVARQVIQNAVTEHTDSTKQMLSMAKDHDIAIKLFEHNLLTLIDKAQGRAMQ